MEREEWRLQVALGREEDTDRTSVDFTVRQLTLPAHAWQEASRYFTQVRALLGPASQSSGDSRERPSAASEKDATSQPHESQPAAVDAPAAAPSATPSAPPEQVPDRH